MLGDFILLELHKIVAIGVFVASLLHIYSKRKKPIKLFNKFLDVVLSSKNSSFCYGVFSGRDGKLYRKANPSELVGRFRKGGVKFKDKNQMLRQIRRKYLLRLPR